MLWWLKYYSWKDLIIFSEMQEIKLKFISSILQLNLWKHIIEYHSHGCLYSHKWLLLKKLAQSLEMICIHCKTTIAVIHYSVMKVLTGYNLLLKKLVCIANNSPPPTTDLLKEHLQNLKKKQKTVWYILVSF